MNQSEQITNVLKGLFQVQTEMNNVVKDSKNPFFKSNYADINALNEELKPLLKNAGLVVLQPPTHINGLNFIQTTVYHSESGEFISSLNEVIAAKQNDPQSFLAAQTYTRRGALQAFFNMGSLVAYGRTSVGGLTYSTGLKYDYTNSAFSVGTRAAGSVGAGSVQLGGNSVISGGYAMILRALIFLTQLVLDSHHIVVKLFPLNANP